MRVHQQVRVNNHGNLIPKRQFAEKVPVLVVPLTLYCELVQHPEMGLLWLQGEVEFEEIQFGVRFVEVRLVQGRVQDVAGVEGNVVARVTEVLEVALQPLLVNGGHRLILRIFRALATLIYAHVLILIWIQLLILILNGAIDLSEINVLVIFLGKRLPGALNSIAVLTEVRLKGN